MIISNTDAYDCAVAKISILISATLILCLLALHLGA